MEQGLRGYPATRRGVLVLGSIDPDLDLAPAVPNPDMAQAVLAYFPPTPNETAVCYGVDDRGVTFSIGSMGYVDPTALPPTTSLVHVTICRFVRSRRSPRAEWRLAMREGQSPLRSSVAELRRDQPTADGPSPGRLVSMSPCRAMAPPVRLVAPSSADALGTAA